MPNSAQATPPPDGLHRLLDLLRCPRCSGNLAAEGETLACDECGSVFPIRDGIPLLAVHGTVETWAARAADESSRQYQQEYEGFEEAKGYNEEYGNRPTKRWSTAREKSILNDLLSGQPRSDVLLDLPSGGGRLSDEIQPYTQLLVEADIAYGQLAYGRSRHRDDGERVWMTASAFHVPFRDEAVDGVVCCRLCHHLPTPEERERLIAELLRVARRFVVMTFFDFHSVKNYIRRARRPLDGKPPKMTMTVDQVRELAHGYGAELRAWPALSHLFSGHRYALMVKD